MMNKKWRSRMRRNDQELLTALYDSVEWISVFIPSYQLVGGEIIECDPYIKDRAFLDLARKKGIKVSRPIALRIDRIDILANIDFRTMIGATVNSRVLYSGDFIASIGTGENAREYKFTKPVQLTREFFPFDPRNIKEIRNCH